MSMMDLEAFDYHLPPSAIAQTPAEHRDGARLLLIDRTSRALTDHVFADLPELLRPGDCVVVNNSRVIPARVLAREASGRAVEPLFVEPSELGRWRALVRPGRRCRPGATLAAGDDPPARLQIVSVLPDGIREVERLDGSIDALLESQGLVPLPPYVARFAKPDVED